MSEEKTTATIDQNNPFNIPGFVPDLQPKFEGGATAAKALTASGETPAERLARLTKLAQIEINKETDAEVVANMVAAERARRAQELLPIDTTGFPADYDKIRVYRGQNKQDKSYVELSLNGYCIKVPRDSDVILPHVFVTECLDHAVEEITIQSQGGLITHPSHRFPYQFMGKATADEYKAFQIEQRALADRQLNTARMSA